jgi:ribonuclease HII
MTLEFESTLGCAAIGVDEAGRGPLAGPVFAAAVHVPLERARELLEGEWSEVNDSKRLSAAKRERLAAAIKANSLWCVASASAAEIDELNILNATHLAMRRAVEGVLSRICGDAAALVDGLPVKGLPCNSVNVVKGDSKSLLIAAASILAKTARDADCLRLEALYPGYGFARHKGYPVKAHVEALRRLGPCQEHRRSFGPVKSSAAPPIRPRA